MCFYGNPVYNRDVQELSDEAYATRHARCEQLEQQRFLHMCAVASNKRRGSGRLLSNADNAPSPSSPAPSPMVKRIPLKPDEVTVSFT